MEIRAKLLEHIELQNQCDPTSTNIQSTIALQWVRDQLKLPREIHHERLLLSEWHELFRTGILSWGHNLANPNPPFCHVTERGRQALEHVRRDPANPAGYMAHLDGIAKLGEIARDYLLEALACYSSGAYKAAAVMVGAAAERLALDLRDNVVTVGVANTKGLHDLRIKKVQDSLKATFDNKKKAMDPTLRENYEAYWPAFTQQIRSARNEAGHPTAIEPLTLDAVHALFLVFPQVAKLASELIAWLKKEHA